jgi:hypothetical protein
MGAGEFAFDESEPVLARPGRAEPPNDAIG